MRALRSRGWGSKRKEVKKTIKLTESEGAKTVWFPCCRRGMRVAAFVVANEAKVVKLRERRKSVPHIGKQTGFSRRYR